jgi:ATP-grasp domain-containing protein
MSDTRTGDDTGTRVWWIGKRFSDALCFSDSANIEFAFCTYGGADLPLLQGRLGATVCPLNDRFVPRQEDQEGFVESILESLALDRLTEIRDSAEARRIIVPYRSSEPIERFGRDHGMFVAGPRAQIVDTMNDNLFLHRGFLEADIPQPRSIIARIENQRFGQVVEQLGSPFYLKRQYSSSGSGCFRIETEEDYAVLRQILDPGEDVLISALVAGPSLNLHGVITNESVSVRTPSVQIVGVPEACDVPTWYSGNDFAAMRLVPRQTAGRAIEVTRQVGEWMRQAGYRGFFGLDVIGDAETMCVLDFNPRMQGSTFLLCDLEIANGIEPASRLHLSAFGVVDPPADSANPIIPLNDALLGSHLILRSRRKTTSTVTRTIAPGVYSTTLDGALVFRRPGLTINDCEEVSEFVVTCSVPYEGSQIAYGAPICKVVTAQSILDPSSGNLNATGRRMAAAVRSGIVLG